MFLRKLIKSLVSDNEGTSGKYFTFFIQFLIVVSLISFSIQTLPRLSNELISTLEIIELLIVIIFTLEYLMRVYVSENKLKYIFSFFGLIDLAAILPFYLSTGLDLRSVRVFRLLRLVRILKLVKYSSAIRRLHRAIQIAKEELILFGCVALMLIYLAAVGIYYFESQAQPEQFQSVFHSLWWAVTTLTTVGYGDMFPITFGGKMFTFFILVIGLGIIAIPTGIFASALSLARTELKEE